MWVQLYCRTSMMLRISGQSAESAFLALRAAFELWPYAVLNLRLESSEDLQKIMTKGIKECKKQLPKWTNPQLV